MDEDLSRDGIEQVMSVAPVIASLSPEVIITSPMKRTVQTATLLMKQIHPEKFELCEGLKERSGGVIEGLTTSQIREKFGIEMTTILSDSISRLPGVESLQHFLERINQTVECIYQKYTGKTILIVTHGGFIRGFYQSNIGIPDARMKFHNCSVLGVTRKDMAWSVIYSMGIFSDSD